MNATTLITASLSLIGVLDPGETPSASAMESGLAAANNLVDNLSTERLNIFTSGFAAYNLTTGKQSYAIGPSATAPDITAPRPVKIDSAEYILPAGGGAGGSALRFPVKPIGQKEWAEIVTRSDASPVAKVLYCDYATPNANLYLFPVPTFSSITAQLELYTWSALTQWPDFTTDVPLAPGYARFLTYALAVDLAPVFAAAVSEAVMASLGESKAAVRALNAANGLMPQNEPTSAPLNAVPPPAPPAAPAPAR